MATQQERRLATRRRILTAAREEFLRGGIEATTTEALLRAAGVSRGAMYHHFASRDDLVAAVYEQEAAASIARAAERIPEDATALDRLLAGCLAWLDEVSRPEIARILIEDGPAVLGWRRCRQIEEKYSLGRIAAELRTADDQGEIDVVAPPITARLLNAVVGEAVLAILAAEDPTAARADVEVTLRALLSGLTRAAGRGRTDRTSRRG